MSLRNSFQLNTNYNVSKGNGMYKAPDRVAKEKNDTKLVRKLGKPLKHVETPSEVNRECNRRKIEVKKPMYKHVSEDSPKMNEFFAEVRKRELITYYKKKYCIEGPDNTPPYCGWMKSTPVCSDLGDYFPSCP